MFGNPLIKNHGEQLQNPISGMMGMMQQLDQFESNFRGDPRQKVEELLTSGKMTPEQFKQLSALAQQIQRFRSPFGRR